MTAYLKRCPARIGIVIDVYYTEIGQRRLTVEFPHGIRVNADVMEFELC